MLKINTNPKESKHKNQFVLIADGYFGDTNETFHEEISFDKDEQDILEIYVLIYSNLKYNIIETRKDLKSWLLQKGITEEMFEVGEIPVDHACYEYLPSVDSVQLSYYDENGIEYEVEYVQTM